MKETARLLVSCSDRRGLVARISDFVFRNGGNFLHFDQHTDLQVGLFLARAEWELDGFQIPRERIAECFQGIALECAMPEAASLDEHRLDINKAGNNTNAAQASSYSAAPH